MLFFFFFFFFYKNLILFSLSFSWYIGVDHVITMDLHAYQTQGFFSVPVDNLLAEPSIAQYLKIAYPNYAAQGVVVAKNAGAVKRVTSLADKLKLDFALIHRTAENVLS